MCITRGLQGRIKAQSYSFDQYFQAYQKDDFVQVGRIKSVSNLK